MFKSVLIVTNSYPSLKKPSASIFMHEQTKALKNEGWNVEVVHLQTILPHRIIDLWKNNKEEVYDGIKVHHVKYLFIPGKKFFSLSILLCKLQTTIIIKKIATACSANIIHGQWITPAGYIAMKTAKSLNIPLICTARGNDVNKYPHYSASSRRYTEHTVRNSNKIISVNTDLRRKILLFGNKEENVITVYNGIDDKLFFTQTLQEKIAFLKKNGLYNKTVLLFVGNLKKAKGITEIIDAVGKLKDKGKKVIVVLIGEGSDKSYFVKRSIEKGVNDQIIFLGQLSHEKLNDWYNACDLFVFPSYSEGLPNALLEAALVGCNIVATDLPGIREIVGDSAYYVEKESSDDLVLKISQALNNPKKPNSEEIKNRFSRRMNISKLMAIYEDIIGDTKEID